MKRLQPLFPFSGQSNLLRISFSLSVRVRSFSILMLTILAFTLGNAQTDFAPGEIMFTGYDSDDPDAFSIVLLKDVVSGTVIYITDRGWSNTTGFRVDNNGEGTISLTFNQAYPCGTSIVFTDIGGALDWEARDESNAIAGTIAIDPTGDSDGIEFNSAAGIDGDQLFIYQLPVPTSGNQSSFVTGIHMNGGPWNTGNGDDYSSQKPNGLDDNEVVRFVTEVDNAKYNCSLVFQSPSALQAAITNDNGYGGLIDDAVNRWTESNNYITLTPLCDFCCPALTLPTVNYPAQVAPGAMFTITLSGGNLPAGAVWELRTAGCNTGTPNTTNGNTFTLTAPATEQTLTYYLQNSAESSCPDNCISFSICVENNLLATCTNCSANPALCGDCFLPPPDDNPDLDSGCFEVKMLIILDESGSIFTPTNYSQDVKNGVLAFLNALNGQDILCALIEFGSTARVVNDYTLINNAYILNIQNYFNGIPYNGQIYNNSGGTNWHDAMLKADGLLPSDLLLFFTDGEPTGWNTTWNDCGSGSTTQTPEIVNPVKLANKFKTLENTHMFMLGVGGGIDVPNLVAMSGPIAYQSGVNTIGDADYSIGNFANLANDLEAFVEELCVTPMIFSKELLGPACDSVVQFRFIITNPGTESAATVVNVIDTFPQGFANPVRIYPTSPFVKFCVGGGCEGFGPPPQGPQPPNTFIWTTNSLPPGGSDTLIVAVNVLPSGSQTNIAWAEGTNTDRLSDTVSNPVINDDFPPIIFCPPNTSVECDESTLPANTGTATASDNSSFPVDIEYTDVTTAGGCPNAYTITRTWRATDICNLHVTCAQVITVDDTTAPDLDCPANVTIACGQSTLPSNTGMPVVTDNCSTNLEPFYSDQVIAGDCPVEMVIQRTWTVEDLCDNVSTCVQTIHIVDTTNPTLACPADLTISCTANTLPAATGSATATDNCSTFTISYADDIQNGSCNEEYIIVRMWTALDQCGNASVCTQTIDVVDIVPPTILCPSNVTIACTQSTLPAQTGNATATDACDGTLAITYMDVTASGGCPQAYTIQRTWKAADGCGNTSTCAQTITVFDTAVPAITCPANTTIQCTASTLPANTGTATASDTCDPSVVPTYTDVTAGGACPQEYTITRTWRAIDDCGNSSTCVQTIFIDDSLAPMIVCPANTTIQCTASTLPANTGSATATDACDPLVTPTYTDVTAAGGCPQEYTITRTWRAVDDCGNSSSCIQTIFIDDSLAPVITCPANTTIQCTASTLPANTGSATATDACDPSVTPTYTDVTTGGGCPQEFTITRTWRAVDDCGNSSSCIQTIFIDDSLAPVITCPANTTVQCTASTLPANTGSATATDACDPSVIPTYTDVTTGGGCPQEYTITRTWRAVDDCGNSSTCVQMIVIDDSVAPVLTCPAGLMIECTASTLPAATGSATATDACDPMVTPTYSDVTAAGACPQEYTITRTWQAIDDCGNSSTCTQTIVVDDSTAPVITCPANTTIQCTASTLPANTGTATVTDACDSSVTATYSDVTAAGGCPQEYTITRTWQAVDDCGNSSSCTQTIFIDDSMAPAITCPANTTVACIASTLPANTGTATATDNCDPSPVVTYVDNIQNPPGDPGYVIQRTWAAVDICGNTSTCLQVITVTNPLDPEELPFDTICSGSVVTFQTSNPGYPGMTFAWSFGSGSAPTSATGAGPHPVSYTYNGTNGTTGAWVFLTLEATGCEAVTDTVTNIHVNVVPVAGIVTPAGTTCIFGQKTFQPSGAAVPGYTYLWNFGAGAVPASANGYGPHTVEYSTGGSKTVQLIIQTNAAGASCSDTATTTFTVSTCPGNISGLVTLVNGTPLSGVVHRLFADNNLDGQPDNTTVIKTGISTSSGTFLMTSVTPGYYVIQQVQPGAYYSVQEDDTSEDFDSLSNIVPNDNLLPVTVEPNELDANNRFWEAALAGIISGYVFNDSDNDQNPDTGEGISGVTIQLFADANQDGQPDSSTPLAATTSNATGYYTFGDLATGHYVIVETQPGSYINVLDIDVSADGDAVANTNQMDDKIPATISANEHDAGNYFIEQSPCSLLVTVAADGGPGSLRYMIDCAQNGDTITIAPALAGDTLYLTLGRITISKTVYIKSTLTPTVAIKSNVNGMFKVMSGHAVGFEDFVIISGLSGFPGAAFENLGDLTLYDVILKPNSLLVPLENLVVNSTGAMLIFKGDTQVVKQ